MKVCPNCGRRYPGDANFCPADAGRLQPDAQTTQRGLAIGAVSGSPPDASGGAIGGRFQLVARLGGGHTGEVYEGRDRDSRQPCAVKLVDPAVFPNPLLLQRAERELTLLERLALPEVARVLAHGRQGERLWVAMELVSGVQMTRLVVEGGPLPPLPACRLVRQMAHGLAEAAKQGVIHHDLAAKNILVGHEESVKIINFPIATPYSDRVQGVPEFLSPEQVEGRPADQRSSIYSLGALLYFAVTGRPPFVGEPAEVHRAHVSGEVVPPSLVAAVPGPVEAVIMKSLEKISARRFMTLHQMMGELDAVQARTLAAPELDAATELELSRAALVQGNAQSPLDGAPTLVGVDFEVQPIEPEAQAAVTVQAPVMLDPMRARPMVGGGQVGGRDADRTAARAPAPLMSVPQPEPAARPPAVIVPTPPGGAPALTRGHGSSNPKNHRKSDKGSPLSSIHTKHKFRETLWFKKGELDEVAAAAAARAQKGELVSDRADALPIEDRYRDDGTLDRQDAERLSLRTGGTALKMKALRAEPLLRKPVSEHYLLGEMRRSRIWIYLFLVLVMAALGGVAYYILR